MDKKMSNARKCDLFNTNLKACLKLYNHEKLKNIELVWNHAHICLIF